MAASDDRKALQSHGKTQHSRLPSNVTTQLARPVARPNDHPSSTQACTCRSPSTRRIAFDERLKNHDVVLEGIDLVLRRLSVYRQPQGREKAVEPVG
jgi:hypothetical protein